MARSAPICQLWQQWRTYFSGSLLALGLLTGCGEQWPFNSEDECPTCSDSLCNEAECDFLSDCRVCPSNWDSTQAEEELRMLELVNEARREGITCPSGPQPIVHELTDNDRLRASARLHALDMGENNYFSHESQNGQQPWDRMEGTGYQGTAFGENIAAGSNQAAITFEQWRTSDGHCLNMMSPDFNEVGIGYARVEGSEYTHYWVQNFGFTETLSP